MDRALRQGSRNPIECTDASMHSAYRKVSTDWTQGRVVSHPLGAGGAQSSRLRSRLTARARMTTV